MFFLLSAKNYPQGDEADGHSSAPSHVDGVGTLAWRLRVNPDMSRLSLTVLIGTLILAVPFEPLAQTRFQSGVDLVALDVCVKTRDGRLARALKREDFLVLENNVAQEIALFAADARVPLAVSLLVDNSQSMSGAPLERAIIAAGALIEMFRPDDLVEVISFNDHASLRYRLGTDHTQARSVLDGLTATGKTALYEAVLVAVHNQRRARPRRLVDHREVIVLLSDGANTVGPLTFDDALEDVRRSGVLVYAVSLRTDARDGMAAPSWQMSKLAFDTGGQAIAVRDLDSLTRVYREIGTELVSLYRVGYVPEQLTADGKWRHLSVRVPDKDVVIRTRSGYYAPLQGVSDARRSRQRMREHGVRLLASAGRATASESE